MTTQPYQEIRRKLPPRAGSSDIHDVDKAPLMADLKTLEHFVTALQAFDASQSKTMVQNKQLKVSTISLSALLAIALMFMGVREIPGLVSDKGKDKTAETNAIDWAGIENRINQRIEAANAGPSEDLGSTKPTPTTVTDEQDLRDALIRLARLQIEQNNYLAEIIAGNAKRRPPPKPSALQAAEHAATSK